MLTSTEIAKIQQFLEDKAMQEAIKKVLIDSCGFPTSAALDNHTSDEVIGQVFRASAVAIQFIKQGFKELEKYKKVEEREPKINEAL